MSISTSARASSIITNVSKGTYVKQFKFAGYNEATEGIVAQQMEADRRLREIQAQRTRKAKGVA